MPKFINIALTEAQLSVIYTALGDRYSYFSGLIRMETDPSKKEVLRSVRNDVRKVHNLVLEALNSPFTSHTDDNPPPSKEGDAPPFATVSQLRTLAELQKASHLSARELYVVSGSPPSVIGRLDDHIADLSTFIHSLD